MLIADSREPEELTSQCDVVRLLPKGDYWICGSGEILKLERKTLTDLNNTLKDGRLNGQLEDVDILLIENSPFLPCDVYRMISSEKMLDIISGISCHHVVMFSSAKSHTLRILRRTEKKIKEDTYGEMRREVRIVGFADPKEAVIAQMPGVGQELATRIMKTYGNLKNAFENIENWKDVPGLGSKKVDALKKFYAGGS